LATRAQLRDRGLSEAAISRSIKAGRLHPLYRGVYLVGHPVPPPLALELAALLACGSTAALSYWTAAGLYRILARADGPIHVTIPDRRCRARSGLQPHFASLPDQDVTVSQGLRVTTAQRTLDDLRLFLDPAAHERATNEAEVLRLVPIKPGKPGITRQEAERRLLALLRRSGLPPTKTNITIQGHEVDALYEEARLIVEVDGYAFHRTRHAFEQDRRRDASLLAAGYRVMRVTYRQLDEEPEAVVVRLARSLP
jgi:very-short-patch-repair endonuclease